MRRFLARTWWAIAFAAALCVPLALSIGVGGQEPVLMRLSIELGLLSTSVLACTVVLPSRFRSLTRTLGIEKVLGSHRYLGLLAVLLVLGHLLAAVVGDPENIARLDLIHGPRAGRAATLSTIAMVLLVAAALLRRRIRLPYEWWRRTHVALAAAAIVLAALHVWWLDHLIRDSAMRMWFVLVACTVLAVAGYRWVWRPIRNDRGRFVLREVRPESATVSTLVLEPCRYRHRRGYRPIDFAPGQFAWLRLTRSALAGQEHPFTVASGARPGQVQFTIGHVGKFTTALRGLQPGRPVWLDGPHGTFTVDYVRATGLVLIAGGVGITPMMSMLRTLADRRDGRPHRLIVVARTEEDLLFRDELAEIGTRIDLTVTEILSRPPAGWTGRVGRIDADLLNRLLPGPFRRNQLDYFICGASPMVDGAREALGVIGIPGDRIHTEQFQMV
jgi:predicted ferric reductase